MRKIIWGLQDHAAYKFKEAVLLGEHDVWEGSRYLENKKTPQRQVSVLGFGSYLDPEEKSDLGLM